jgi:hypothetical protein
MSSPTMQTAKKGNNLIIALREQRALQGKKFKNGIKKNIMYKTQEDELNQLKQNNK